MRRSFVVLAFAAILLSGCISGQPKTDSYTDSKGKTTLIESDSEMCTHSCNDDYDRCMETAPASQNLPGEPSGMFGASADCKNDLRRCLRGCKSQ